MEVMLRKVIVDVTSLQIRQWKPGSSKSYAQKCWQINTLRAVKFCHKLILGDKMLTTAVEQLQDISKNFTVPSLMA